MALNDDQIGELRDALMEIIRAAGSTNARSRSDLLESTHSIFVELMEARFKSRSTFDPSWMNRRPAWMSLEALSPEKDLFVLGVLSDPVKGEVYRDRKTGWLVTIDKVEREIVHMSTEHMTGCAHISTFHESYEKQS